MSDLSIRNVKRNIKILKKLEEDKSLEIDLALKLALMECCGWIEEKMHFIIFKYVDANITHKLLNKETKNNISNKNYSFQYKAFRDKLVATLGEYEVIKFERIMGKSNNSVFDFDHFKTNLSELKKERDKHAHTYTRIGTSTVNLGFSEIEQRINYINRGLNKIQQFVFRRCKIKK